MKQATQRMAERRTEEQQAGSFTFWFRRPQATKQVGAWMLAQSANEAAFLTAARDAPRIGEQLELTDLGTTSLTIPQAVPPHLSHLPKFGRVVRLDKPQGVTRRVAIQFEEQPRSRLVRTGEDRTAPSQL